MGWKEGWGLETVRAVTEEGAGDGFEEDEAKDDVLVFRHVHVAAQPGPGTLALTLCWRIGHLLARSLFKYKENNTPFH